MYSPYGDIDMREDREGESPHGLGMARMNSDRTMSVMSLQQYTGRPHDQRPREFSHETLQLSDTDTPSEESWPEEDPQPLPPERKRSSSPSMAFASPNKRHRNENTANGIHSFHKASDLRAVNHQRPRFDSNFAGRPRTGLEISSVDRSRRHMSREMDEEGVGARNSFTQAAFLHDDATARFHNERDRYARAQSQPPRQHLRTSRATSRIPDNARKGFPHMEHQESSPYRTRSDDIERQELKVEQGRSSELRDYERFGSIAPENFSARVEQVRSARQLSQSYAVQPPMLGSAIWENDMEHPRGSTPATKVTSKYMATNGIMTHPHDDLPRTPNNRQDREQSVAPRSSALRRREQNVAPQTPRNHQDRSTLFQTPIIRRSQSRGFASSSLANHREWSSSRHTQTPSFGNIPRGTPQTPQHHYEENGSDTSGPALEDYIRKAPRGSQRTVRASPSNAGQVLPRSGIFSKAPLAPQNTRRPLFQMPRSPPIPRPEPEVIDLCSPIISLPMKERIPSVKPSFGNRPITKPNVLPQNKPKIEWKSKIENKPQDECSAEIERQRKAAELILEKEENAKAAALQLEIFGEVVPEDDETRKRREEKERAENQRRREAAELEKATKQEQKRLAEVEKARQRAEAAEQARIAKEEEEAINKQKRDAERKRQEAAEALEREKLRQKAEEKIQADRLRKAAEDAEREREKQKATAIQAEQAELAKLRAKQEETRKQVASLSIPKLAALNRKNGDSHLDDADSDDVSIDNPLFVSDEPSKLNDDPLQNSAMPISHNEQADQLTPRKPIGPTTAAAVMAVAQTKKSTPSYRDIREARDAELAREKRENSRNELVRRWNQKALSRAPEPTQGNQAASQPAASVSFPGPNPSSNPTRGVKSAAKGKSASQPTPARKRPSMPKTTALFQQTLESGNFLGGLTKQLNHKLSKQTGPSSICSSVAASEAPANLISDPQHQKLLEEKAAREKAKKEAYNARQRKKLTENARIRQRQKLIDEASSAGKEVSEEELNAQVEAFMKDREERRLKTAETKAEKEQMQRAFPKFGQNYRKESYAHSKMELTNSFATPLVYHSEPEEEIFDSQSRAANRAPVREPLTAVARERGDQFSRTASRKTCADFEQDSSSQELAARIRVTPGPGDSSEESEEDPDDEPSPPSSHTASNDAQVEYDEYEETEDDFSSDGSDEDDDDDGLPKKSRKPNKLNSNNLDTQVVKSLIQRSQQSGDEYFSEIEPETIFTYTVRRIDRKERIDREPKTVETYLDRNEANKYIRTFLKKRAESRRHPAKVLEHYDPVTELYRGEVDWVLDGDDAVESVTLWIRRELKTITNVDNFKDKKYVPRLPNKSWVIKKKTLQKIIQVGKPIREKETEDVTNTVADLTVANHEACKMFLEITKPTKLDDIMNHLVNWTNILTPALHKARDEHCDKGLPLNLEFDTKDSIPWKADKYVTMGFEVQLYDMEGPRN